MKWGGGGWAEDASALSAPDKCAVKTFTTESLAWAGPEEKYRVGVVHTIASHSSESTTIHMSERPIRMKFTYRKILTATFKLPSWTNSCQANEGHVGDEKGVRVSTLDTR